MNLDKYYELGFDEPLFPRDEITSADITASTLPMQFEKAVNLLTTAEIQKGDKPGHVFHGNQWREGEGGNRTQELLARVRAAGADLGVHENNRMLEGVNSRQFVQNAYKEATTEQRDLIAKTYSDFAKASFPVINLPKTALEKVLFDGRFKSQFESGASKGFLSPSYRGKSENQMFGYPLDTPAEIRPIYGYLSTVDPEQGTDHSGAGCRAYGEISVVLNPDVKERTTYTVGDSLGTRATPALVNETDPIKVLMSMTYPNEFYLSPQLSDAERVASGAITMQQFIEGNSAVYVEAQFHGGISVSDIAKVVLPAHYNPNSTSELVSNGEKLVLISHLEEAGIPYAFASDSEYANKSVAKGDKPGHVFRGNQYKEGEGSGENPKLAALRKIGVRLGEHVNPDTKYFQNEMGLSKNEVEAAGKLISSVMKKATPVIMVSRDVLPMILQDGRFKSQFESGKSGGFFNPNIRSDAEGRLFGYPTEATPNEMRPIYGTVAFTDPTAPDDFFDPSEPSIGRSAQYGNIRVVLKDDVLNRTTYTVGDSLVKFGVATPALMTETNPQACVSAISATSATGAGFNVQKVLSQTDAPDVRVSKLAYNYVETQIHGGVSLSDIAKVVFPNNKEYDQLRELTKAAGIQVESIKKSVAKGDKPGHKFRGNQYKEGEGENRTDELLARVRAAGAELGVHENPHARSVDRPGFQFGVRNNNRQLVEYEYGHLTDVQRNGIAKAFSDAAKASFPVINVASFILAKVLEDGRFKTQFESGTSGGSLNPSFRAMSENQMFGYSETDTPNEIRPVYGILTTVDPVEGTDTSSKNTYYYGEISVVLKDSVKDRTTYVMGDSLGTPATPALVNETDPTKVLMAQHFVAIGEVNRQVADLARVDDGTMTPAQFLAHNTSSYTEAQFHGGVTLQDISKVVLPKNLIYSPLPEVKGLIENLNKAGITYTFRK